MASFGSSLPCHLPTCSYKSTDSLEDAEHASYGRRMPLVYPPPEHVAVSLQDYTHNTQQHWPPSAMNSGPLRCNRAGEAEREQKSGGGGEVTLVGKWPVTRREICKQPAELAISWRI